MGAEPGSFSIYERNQEYGDSLGRLVRVEFLPIATGHPREVMLEVELERVKRKLRRWRVLGAVCSALTCFGLLGTAVHSTLDCGGQSRQAQVQAYEIEKALKIYKLSHADFPTRSEGLRELVAPQKGKPLMDSIPIDPWNNEYLYLRPGVRNPATFDVLSAGPDLVFGTCDDIGNWMPG